MAHFAIVAPPFAGHLNPLSALCGRLAERGHRISFVNQADAAPLLDRARFGFEAVGLGSHPPGSLRPRIERMARLNGPIGFGGLIRDIASLTDMLCRELPAALRRIGADALISDQTEAAGGLVAAHLGLPMVSVATALPINREPGVPPPYVGWGHDPSAWGLRRNAGGWRITDWLMRPVARVVADHAERLGLPARRGLEGWLSPSLQLAQGVASLDFPRVALPPGFHYCGSWRDDEAGSLDLPDDDPRPLAFCSLGTLLGSRAAIFRRVAAACDGLGLRLVIAHGGRLTEDEARTLPGRPLVRDFVPQRALLARSAVAISHCGLNTVLDALSSGTPILALPIAFEQPATAARIAFAGAGRMVSPRSGRRRVRRELSALLAEPGYRRSASRVGEEIAAAGGADGAARRIEAWLISRSGQPCP